MATAVSAQEPWRLPQPDMLQQVGVNTGGWIQMGITMNAEDPADRFNGPVLMNDRHGDFQMHQLWLYFERPCDTGGYGVDLGGRVDLLYGTDWRVALAHGLGMEDRINGLNQLYGFALPQMYLEAGLNRLSIKMGRMAGILGYEIVPPMANFFYSHSYAICYTEPFTPWTPVATTMPPSRTNTSTASCSSINSPREPATCFKTTWVS